MAEVPGIRVRGNASSLNPSAGHHVVTADPRELTSVDRAGERSWSAWTYYARRYGERGRLFTRSDSAWIATLAANPSDVVERQIRWLGAVLAARGMPRLLLVEHLRLLHEELVAAVPERASDYAVLLQVAETLGAEVRAFIAEPTFASLETGFRAQVEGTDEDDVRAGALIGAAVADELAGIQGAVESLMDWLADPARFSAKWISAVEQTLTETRRSAAEIRKTEGDAN